VCLNKAESVSYQSEKLSYMEAFQRFTL